MSTITKDQAKDLRNAFQCWQQDYDPAEDKEQYDMFGLGIVAMDALLASLEAEVVGYVDAEYAELLKSGHIESCSVYVEPGDGCITVFTAQPEPVSVPDEATPENIEILASTFAPRGVTYQWDRDECNAAADSWNACRAAMLQGGDTELHSKAAIHDALCAKYNVESLADFVEWQRNHIAELEAAPPAPVGEGETAVMPDYPGYVMTQREFFQAGKKAGLTEAGNAPVIPDGYALVPIEPTAHMQSAAAGAIRFETTPINKLWTGNAVYKAMLAAAPKQEDKP
ncbi:MULTISPECIES: hypothetical protein [Enterobacter]|uniref:hypothetical protein n=1 Tax=Enterobacter TaxID=547 RepID=UPI001BE0A880|nr:MULTISPECIES: hypothetical protein [Enterobacter]MBT2063952.1 hypothetical protein [Enterobacter hormaechei subsp. xiangfangensis]MBY7208501.1 hypothetical protein [Enterobacter hormaechei]MCM7700302.1 hypothetical protein [Enterobacter hormaechei]MCM7705004.1 hypothetical protein [Enterobacter hormaechei]MCM7709566.1 hypothetical protein [Enterobacter hormaechei]